MCQQLSSNDNGERLTPVIRLDRVSRNALDIPQSTPDGIQVINWRGHAPTTEHANLIHGRQLALPYSISTCAIRVSRGTDLFEIICVLALVCLVRNGGN